MRPSGIEAVGDVPWGTHFCQFYRDEQDLIETLVPYFSAGLENNEFCMWVTSEPLQAREAAAALRRAVPHLDQCLGDGQIEILDHSQWYTPDGRFESDRVLTGWVNKLEAARRSGFEGLRLSGNASWIEKVRWQGLTAYEAALEAVLRQYRMLVICTYSLDRCDATEILDVMSNHEFALIQRDGRWSVIQNAERKQARIALHASEHRFRTLFNGMTQGFALHEILCDAGGRPCDYRFLDINPAFERLTGLKREDVVGRTVRQVLPRVEPEWIRTYGKVALTGESTHFEAFLSELGRHYEVFAYRPAPRQFAAVFMDITQRKQVEQTLRRAKDELEQRVGERTAELAQAVESLKTEMARRDAAERTLAERSRMLEAFFKHATTPLVFLDRKFNFIRVNEVYARACGRDVAAFSGRNHFELYPDAENQAIFEKVVRTRTPHVAFAKPFCFPDHPEWGVTYWDWTLTPLLDGAGEVEFLVFTLEDVTQRTRAEQKTRVTGALLELFAHKNTRKEYLDSVLEVLRDFSGCRCLGIRVIDHDQNIPYESHTGFSRDFLEKENQLSLRTDACACVRAILGKLEEQDRPATTTGGSFHLNDSATFFAQLSDPQKGRFRGTCLCHGFGTIAVIPLRYQGRVFGTIHLADERKDLLSRSSVEFLESRAPLIAEAIYRFNAEAELDNHRRHLEGMVRQRTAELERTTQELRRSNNDLEQFAYVASHDLQEPLRMVTGYLQLLERRYKDGLDADAREFIGFAVDGGRRMSNLITDLLDYSRVNTRGSRHGPVAVELVLERALANLRAALEESRAVITHGPLPTVTGDGAQLVQLFQNLIANAVKFRSPDRAARVHICAQTDDNGWLFRVQDNGIGLEPQYAEKIFLIFQRLHGRTAYPGTGIGLAVCRRIVERHGGRIWVQSRPGEGSTFLFTIPGDSEG